MAAIAAKLALVGAFTAAGLWADRAADVLSQVAYAANALSNDNPSDAMTPFDKSCKDYDRIEANFAGLTQAYAVRNELSVSDEDDSSGTETKLVVNWRITLSPKAGVNQTNGPDTYSAQPQSEAASAQRTGDIQVRLILKKGKWKIAGFTPLTIFDPEVTAQK